MQTHIQLFIRSNQLSRRQKDPLLETDLRFNGKVLKDEGRSLLSCNVCSGSILQLMVSVERADEPSSRDVRLGRLRL